MPEPSVLDDPTLLLAASSYGVNERVVRRLADAGFADVRTVHGYVFQHLLSGPKTIGELADLLGVTQQGASKSVAELERLGYVARQVAEGDLRVRQVHLTERGQAAIDAGRAARADVRADLEELLGARGLAVFLRALRRVAEHTGGLETLTTRRLRPTN
jgi:DNA-binding MarR family transcriptional regulator